jgi:hypothetical protein
MHERRHAFPFGEPLPQMPALAEQASRFMPMTARARTTSGACGARWQPGPKADFVSQHSPRRSELAAGVDEEPVLITARGAPCEEASSASCRL